MNNPSRFFDPTGHTSACAYNNRDPECDQVPFANNNTPSLGSACGSTYSDPECGENNRNKEITTPDAKREAAAWGLAGYDPRIYRIWLTLFLSQSGHDLALFILENGIEMRFWGDIYSMTECGAAGNCTISLSLTLAPSSLDTNLDPAFANLAAATLGHEAYHALVYTVGQDSQWEEAMVFYVEDKIYFELTWMSKENYSSLYVTDEKSLQNWIDTYHSLYKYYDSYPGIR